MGRRPPSPLSGGLARAEKPGVADESNNQLTAPGKSWSDAVTPVLSGTTRPPTLEGASTMRLAADMLAQQATAGASRRRVPGGSACAFGAFTTWRTSGLYGSCTTKPTQQPRHA